MKDSYMAYATFFTFAGDVELIFFGPLADARAVLKERVTLEKAIMMTRLT